MKRFLIPLLAALALPTAVEANWFGKYGSYREAKEACNELSIKGGKSFHMNRIDVEFEYDIRSCENEKETNQILGVEYINLKPVNYTWREWDEIENPYKEKVKKRFKY